MNGSGFNPLISASPPAQSRPYHQKQQNNWNVYTQNDKTTGMFRHKTTKQMECLDTKWQNNWNVET